MKGIEIKNGCIYFYGNPAGYINKETATLDNMFQGSELESWCAKRNLTPQWMNGIYDKLISGNTRQTRDTPRPFKSCRIWQLKPDVDVLMKFISYEEMIKQFGEPETDNYDIVYDGQIETNNLEDIWTEFNSQLIPNFTGHSLSMSDIIELYDHTGSDFYYVDRFGFKEIAFSNQNPVQFQDMTMNM